MQTANPHLCPMRSLADSKARANVSSFCNSIYTSILSLDGFFQREPKIHTAEWPSQKTAQPALSPHDRSPSPTTNRSSAFDQIDRGVGGKGSFEVECSGA